MTYNSIEIIEAVEEINDRYYLPAIQRELVWDMDQITRLFDSLMRNYPIGSFLFWKLDDDRKDDFVKYEFIRRYATNTKHITTGAQKRNEITEAKGHSDIRLVLDGQQRLSSLYIGLKGSYTDKEKWKQRDNPDAWKEKFLYLNLLSDPDKRGDGEQRLQYEFKFKTKPPEQEEGKYWFRVGDILDVKNRNEKIDLIKQRVSEYPEPLSEEQEDYIHKNLDQLFNTVHNYELNYFLEKEQDIDRVLDIFIRTNEGGTQLSKSDLLLSMATANWSRSNAREEITNFVDRINTKLDHPNDFDKDFILKSALVLSDLPVRYLVENFTKDKVADIEEKWTDMKDAITKAVRLINRFGITEENLTSQNAVIPIAYFFMQNPDRNLLSDSKEDARDRERIHRWFVTSLINGTFSGQADNVLRNIRNQLREKNDEFPIDEINSEIRGMGKLVGFNEEVLENILETKYGKKRDFLVLSLLYDRISWGNISKNKDHIFPADNFDNEEELIKEYGPEKAEKYQEAKDKIANLQILTEQENKKKLEKDFKDWIRSRDDKFYERHLIPKDESLYDMDNFLEFKEERERLIANRLTSLFQ